MSRTRKLIARLLGLPLPDGFRVGPVISVTRRFGPKTADHPSAGQPCPACGHNFAAGDYTTLALLGPGADAEQRRKAVSGLAYTAVGVEVHWACATGEESTP